MTRTTNFRADLFLLKADFEDPAFPGQLFFCRHGALVEGVLAAYPDLGRRLVVHRVDFPRPREVVVVLAGEANQSLPRLILPPGVTVAGETSEHRGRASVGGADAIIAAFVELYGIAPPHP